jgi:hypothetical protein
MAAMKSKISEATDDAQTKHGQAADEGLSMLVIAPPERLKRACLAAR